MDIAHPQQGLLAQLVGGDGAVARQPGAVAARPALAATWMGWPLWMLVATAGLRTIPRSIHEAAALEGASRWRLFAQVTLPLLVPLLAAAFVVRGVAAFNQFYLFWVLGTDFQTTTLSTFSYSLFNSLRARPVLGQRGDQHRHARRPRPSSSPGSCAGGSAPSGWRSGEPAHAPRPPRPPGVPRARRRVRPAADLGPRPDGDRWLDHRLPVGLPPDPRRADAGPVPRRVLPPGRGARLLGPAAQQPARLGVVGSRGARAGRDDGLRVRADALPRPRRRHGRGAAGRVPAAGRARRAAVHPVQRVRAQRARR